MTTKCQFAGVAPSSRARELGELIDRHRRLANALTADLATVTDARMHMEVSSRIVRHWEQCHRLEGLLRDERGY